jgi:hypothetical protein
MWMVWLLVCFLFAAPAVAESDSSEKYERDSKIFNPAQLFSPNNSLNPAQNYSAPDNSFNPAHRYDPSNPTNPANRYIPNNPFNPANQSNPQNPLNPANGYNNPTTPFQSLNHSR